jgi:D-alanyl-D-alanine dipeptidase
MDLTLLPLDTNSGASPPVEHALGACTAPAADREVNTSIDMGTGFDCFDVKANTEASGLRRHQ